MTDEEAVRAVLAGWGSWTRPDDAEYVGKVTARMVELHAEHPDGEFPSPIHGGDDLGACVECDALKALDRLSF